MRLKKCIPPLLHGNATFQKQIVTDRPTDIRAYWDAILPISLYKRNSVTGGLLKLDIICRIFLTTDEHEHLKESLRSKKTCLTHSGMIIPNTAIMI